jgi:hypothetical protein
MSPSLTRAFAAVVIVFSLGACSKKEAPSGVAAGEGTSAPAAAGGLGLAFLNGFEGEIGILFKDATKATKPTPPLALMIKDNKVRVELPAEMAASNGMGSKGYAVLNTPEKKVYAVLEEKKQVVLIDLDKAGEQLKNFGGMDRAPRDPREPKESPSHPPPKVTKTGQKDSVAGYACEIWDIVPDTGEKLSACVANEGASWFRLPLTGIPTEHAWALELLDGKHFPLRGIAYDKSGAEKGRVEVTKIEKKALAAALFEIPAGYKVVDLQQMFAAFGSMGAMGAAPMMGKMPPGIAAQMGAAQRGAPTATPKRP